MDGVLGTHRLYLMEHVEWGLLQFGITNVPGHRVSLHASRGWHLLDLVGPMPGTGARSSERAILRSLSTHRATPAPAVVAERFDGYTEAWAKGSYTATSVLELLNRCTAWTTP